MYVDINNEISFKFANAAFKHSQRPESRVQILKFELWNIRSYCREVKLLMIIHQLSDQKCHLTVLTELKIPEIPSTAVTFGLPCKILDK